MTPLKPTLRKPQAPEAATKVLPPNAVPQPHGGYLVPARPGDRINPSGGHGGLYREAQRICREATPAASRAMVELLNDPDSRIRLMAADKIWERGFGKPRDYNPADDKGRMVLDASKLTDHQLEVMRQVMNSDAFRTNAETTER